MAGPHERWAVLRVRTATPHGVGDRQRSMIDRLQRLTDKDALQTFDVDVWGEGITVSDTPTAHTGYTEEVFYDLQTWADRHGHTLEPAFERRSRGSIVTEGTHETIVFPLWCLTVHDHEELRAVYPHSDGDRVRTVADGLDAIEEGRLARAGGSAESTETPDPSPMKR